VLPRRTNIISLAETGDGRILAGSFGEGLWVLDADGSRPFQIDEQGGLSNGSILSVAVAGDTIWLATLGGVQYCAGGKWNFRPFAELGAGYVYKIVADAGGRVWFGADGMGLSVLEKGKWRRLDAGFEKAIKTVTDICTDEQGQIWFISPTYSWLTVSVLSYSNTPMYLARSFLQRPTTSMP
jgi:ligand-binding sensor domain-containing protein